MNALKLVALLFTLSLVQQQGETQIIYQSPAWGTITTSGQVRALKSASDPSQESSMPDTHLIASPFTVPGNEVWNITTYASGQMVDPLLPITGSSWIALRCHRRR